jgi:peptide/nickel transport system permease protein
VILYAVKRLLVVVPLLLMTSFVVFSFIWLAPGDPATMLLGGHSASAATLAAIDARYHLHDPFFMQYAHWLGGALHGDLGQSIAYKDTVWSVVSGRLVPTLELGVYATAIVLLFGLVLGIVSALRRGGPLDLSLSTVTLVLSSISAYVSAIVLISLMSVQLGWFPVSGLGQGFGDRLYHLTLPAIALAASLVALVARVTRSSMLRVLDEEFVENCRGRGFSERRVVLRHALRSAIVPVLTVSGLAAGYLISGAVLVEYTFGLNGLGALLIEAVRNKDFAVVQAVALIFTTAFILINLAVDLLYGLVDPRVRLEAGRA